MSRFENSDQALSFLIRNEPSIDKEEVKVKEKTTETVSQSVRNIAQATNPEEQPIDEQSVEQF